MKSKFLRYLFWFVLGALCFFISQPVIRIPLLSILQRTTWFTAFSFLNPILSGCLIALTAGIAEESFRFLFKKFLIKPEKSSYSQPIIFGLGHGLMEACLILLPSIFMGYSLSSLSWGFIERALAILMHISFSVIVWNGFQKNKKGLYLLIAILAHGAVDSTITFFAYYKWSVFAIEGAFAAMTVILLTYAILSKKYYIQIKGEKNEEEN